MNVTITKLNENLYSAVTDIFMSDGTMRADPEMGLRGNALVSRSRPGLYRVDGVLRFNLGPVSLAAIAALNVGDSVTLN